MSYMVDSENKDINNSSVNQWVPNYIPVDNKVILSMFFVMMTCFARRYHFKVR